jgi:hypothetical protein
MAAGTASNMPRPVMLRADMLPFVVAAGMATILSTMRAVARATQGAHITRPAVVIGEVITDIHTMGYSGYSLSYCGLGYSYPYYGYWPYLGLSFGFNGY